jgi:hypothetical protein
LKSFTVWTDEITAATVVPAAPELPVHEQMVA